MPSAGKSNEKRFRNKNQERKGSTGEKIFSKNCKLWRNIHLSITQMYLITLGNPSILYWNFTLFWEILLHLFLKQCGKLRRFICYTIFVQNIPLHICIPNVFWAKSCIFLCLVDTALTFFDSSFNLFLFDIKFFTWLSKYVLFTKLAISLWLAKCPRFNFKSKISFVNFTFNLIYFNIKRSSCS